LGAAPFHSDALKESNAEAVKFVKQLQTETGHE
jgi:hypothetical protein